VASTVFLLGAGFSRAISSEMPVMNELSQLVRARLDENGRPLPPETVAFGDDIERWLSYLAEPMPWLDEASGWRNRAAFVDVSQEVGRVLSERQRVAVETAQPSWLQPLADYWLRSESTVITFNYDTLVEAAALSSLDAVKYAWASLYRVAVSPAATRISAVAGWSSRAPLSLLKLHGSITWYWSGPTAAAHDPIFDIGLRGGWTLDGLASPYEDDLPSLVADKVPVVVPPTATKSRFYENALLKSQWQQAAQALRGADELVLIGYSLPQSDLVVRSLLLTSLAKDALITPVDRDVSLGGHLEELFGRKVGTRYLLGEDAVATFVQDRCE
jgi:hypothetical protein